MRTLDRLDAPVLTCEAVLSEAWFLARRGEGETLRASSTCWPRSTSETVPAWRPAHRRAILRQYADRASVADASLLVARRRAADGRVVVTTDREDFAVYRLHRRRAVPALVPPA